MVKIEKIRMIYSESVMLTISVHIFLFDILLYTLRDVDTFMIVFKLLKIKIKVLSSWQSKS